MAPCCARDIMDMRRSSALNKRLSSVDVSKRAVAARMMRMPEHLMVQNDTHEHAHNSGCVEDCEEDLDAPFSPCDTENVKKDGKEAENGYLWIQGLIGLW